MGRLLGVAHFTFHEGKAEEFKRLSGECMQVVREQDTGTLRYDIFLDADETGAVVIEEYADERALVEHGEHLGEALSSAVIATADVHGELLGDLSPELRDQLDGGPVTAYLPWLSLTD